MRSLQKSDGRWERIHVSISKIVHESQFSMNFLSYWSNYRRTLSASLKKHLIKKKIQGRYIPSFTTLTQAQNTQHLPLNGRACVPLVCFCFLLRVEGNVNTKTHKGSLTKPQCRATFSAWIRGHSATGIWWKNLWHLKFSQVFGIGFQLVPQILSQRGRSALMNV